MDLASHTEEAALLKKGQRKKPHSFAKLLKGLVYLSIVLISGLLLWMLGYILLKGVPYLTTAMFSLTYTTENLSMFPAILNTLSMILLTLLIACPVGIFAAIYFVEYAAAGSRGVKLLRLATETLAGVPSIIFGLFGYLCFVVFFKMGYSLLAGCLTLAILVLPVIIRTTEEALIATPQSYREASFALGAGKVRTIFRIVLPNALPGIVSGIILSVGRIIGETAALIYTAGTIANVAGPLDSGRTLAVHMFSLLSEGVHVEQANSTAVILILLVVLLNFAASLITKKLRRNRS